MTTGGQEHTCSCHTQYYITPQFPSHHAPLTRAPPPLQNLCSFPATLDEFGLLERLNHLAAAKYSELADTASGLESFLESAKAKYGELACFLGEIDDIHASVGELEAVVAQLDAYTKRLEARAREIES